jgi:hypothetical protein
MTSEVSSGQDTLFTLPEQVPAAAPIEHTGEMMPLGAHWGEPDPREVVSAEARTATLSEGAGWSPDRVRAATGVGEVVAGRSVDAGLPHRDWTVAGRQEHLAGAARTRAFLDELGFPPTRNARERSGE